MTTLTIPNVPPDILALLRPQATRANRSVEEKAPAALEVWATRPAAEDTGPGDFARPLHGPTVAVRVGGERVPARPVIRDAAP